jgi:hypothetical protein
MKSILIALVLAGALFAGTPDSLRTDENWICPTTLQAGVNLHAAANCQVAILVLGVVGAGLTAGTGGVGWAIGCGIAALGFHIAGIYNLHHAGTNLMPVVPVDSTSTVPAKIFTAPY